MAIQLVGAGLPRTGTSSLREALRHLLGAPVHHMSEVFAHPEQAATWTRALQGEPPDWEEFLAAYAAGVDVPFSGCWRELAAAYPDAPVLLSHRGDPEVWLRSMEATVLPRIREMRAGEDDDPLVPLFRVLLDDVVDDLDDPASLVAGYERRLREVRAEVPSDRLVEWRPQDGWEPLCEALRLPVPDLPFPHENSTADHVARHASRARRDRERRTTQLRTARLVLHPVDLAEAGRIAEQAPGPEDRWAPDFPQPGEVRATASLVRRLHDGEEVGPFGFYRLERSADGRAVGGIGFKGAPVGGSVEVGYGLAPSARGHGLAAEALVALVERAGEHGVAAVVADTHPDNLASRRTLERAGFVPVGAGPDGTDRFARRTATAVVADVREVGPADWPAWRALRRAALAQAPQAFGSRLADWSGAGDTEVRWRARLTEIDLNLLLAVAGRDVAMVSGDRVATASGEHVVEVLSLWVDPAVRGRGVGDQAVAAVLERVRATHPGLDVVLSVKQDNAAAVRLYERHGFVDDGVSSESADERRMVLRAGR